MSKPNRVQAGTPAGGRFAAKARSEANLSLVHCEGQITIDEAIAEVQSEATRELVQRRAFSLVRLAEDGFDARQAHEALPNLFDPEVRSRLAGIAEALRTAEKFEDDPADAAYDAASHERIVDIEDFGGYEQDRFDEAPMRGYDFEAYGCELAEAWRQRAYDEAKDAVQADMAVDF